MSKRGKNIGSFFIKQAKELPSQETDDVNCESEMSEEEEPQSKDPHEVPVCMVSKKLII